MADGHHHSGGAAQHLHPFNLMDESYHLDQVDDVGPCKDRPNLMIIALVVEVSRLDMSKLHTDSSDHAMQINDILSVHHSGAVTTIGNGVTEDGINNVEG